MKIIDNKKDYYDYLSGVYGVDDKVVYDRRGSIPSTVIVSERNIPFFSKEILDSNHGDRFYKYDEPIKSNFYNPEKYYSKSTCDIVIEAGYKHFYINVLRFREKKDDPITITYTGINEDDYWKNKRLTNKWNFRWMIERLDKEEADGRKKLTDVPLAIIFYDTSSNVWNNRNHPVIYKNPILKDIPGISGCVNPEWIWQSVYEYISSLNDKEIVDNRTDVEKLESAGFDKKISFRKM